MLRVLNCIAFQHDWRQVMLAVAVCFVTSLAAVNLFTRARTASVDARLAWLLMAGIVAGCGTWATHFIAMLAYTPGVPIHYDPVITACSLIAATVITTAGFAVAQFVHTRQGALAGGALTGIGIACMHYMGMASLRIPAVIVWQPELVLASIVIGVLLGAAAILVAQRSDRPVRLLEAALLLTLAIGSHHFVSMGAIDLMILPDAAEGGSLPSPIELSMAIAAFTATVVIAGLAVAVVGQLTGRNISERNLLLDTALNNMAQGLCMYNSRGLLELWNDSFLRMYRIAPASIFVGATIAQVIALRKASGGEFKDMDVYETRMRASIAGRTPGDHTSEVEDGRTIRISFLPMKNGGWVATHADVTDRKLSEARIVHLARHDPITDLPNRVALYEYLADVCREASAAQASFAVVSIDIDRFKEINVVYGQSTGDAVLVELARRIGHAANGAFLARPGDGDFCIVAMLGAEPNAIEDLCAQLSKVLENRLVVDGRHKRVRCSIGISVYPQDGADVETLVSHADMALARAKAEERGTILFFEAAMDRQIREKQLLQRDLVVALENKQFALYYQPQATVDGAVVGFEALLRWCHPERGMVSPAVFIPLAEETGMIRAIDAWVLREACREAATWPNPLSIAVNLSPIDFQRGDVPAMLAAVLAETGLAPERLEVEVTEGVLIADFAGAIAILRAIKALGVRVAMDDFGTGYSSLSYLQAFPFDKIKIDQTFVANLESNPQSAAIVHAVIGLGRSLRLPVIAEGVETMAQLTFLAEHGCAEIQGYLIGRPQPIAHYQGVVTGAEGAANVLTRARRGPRLVS